VLRPGDALVAIDPQGNKVGDGRVKKIYVRVVSIPFPLPMEKP
jgi:hypothetical protein